MMDKLLEIVGAGLVTWLVIFIAQFKNMQKKLNTIQEKEADEKIETKVHDLSNSDLDARILKNIGRSDKP